MSINILQIHATFLLFKSYRTQKLRVCSIVSSDMVVLLTEPSNTYKQVFAIQDSSNRIGSAFQNTMDVFSLNGI